jgi:hypothetical protein
MKQTIKVTVSFVRYKSFGDPECVLVTMSFNLFFVIDEVAE